MKFIADFHIHSHYSIATSKILVPEYLDYWAQIKGIKVVGTGDFTHPGWTQELKEKLEPAEPGLFKLKNKIRKTMPLQVPASCENEPRFLLTSEISSIYKKYNKVRKVHNVILAPDFETVEKIQQKLSLRGNITSDGRPILGLDSKNLLEIALEASEQIFFIPAHIWTPWFSVLGDKSGFNTIQECYQDLTKYIFAVETGLSTDAPMHWMCSFLDKYTLISNSDAHSPEKLGRNANLFDTELSYTAIINAMKNPVSKKFLGTIDLFPQEGKYHYDGHRKCKVCLDPLQTLKNHGLCPVCGKKVTVGVMNRVMQLSDRQDLSQRKNRLPFHSIIPLKEILSEIACTGVNSKKVCALYDPIIAKNGPELEILLNTPLEKIKQNCGELIAEAIKRVRGKKVYIQEGFDGEYGKIKVFKPEDVKYFNQQSLFTDITNKKQSVAPTRNLINFDLSQYQALRENLSNLAEDASQAKLPKTLNQEQQKAVNHFNFPALIIAGPGTGKTRVITHRILYLIKQKNILPENILTITFTNKAANEITQRIKDKTISDKLNIYTFHSFGFSILKEYIEKTGRKNNFSIIDSSDKQILLKHKLEIPEKKAKQISQSITAIKQNLDTANEITDKNLSKIFIAYEDTLKSQNLFDLEDLIYQTVMLFKNYPETLNSYRKKYLYIMIDEYQDINFSQYQLIKYLMPDKNSNLFAIGDPDQAIYGFRGADAKFIKQFSNDYSKKLSIYKMGKSYRCSDYILKAAGKIIQDKQENFNFIQGLKQGIKTKITENTSDKSEAEFIARTIEEMIGGLRFFSLDSNVSTGEQKAEINSLSDFAVLCRIKAQLPVIEKAFNDHSIPFQTITEDVFFKQEPIKTIIALLRLYYNPANNFLEDILLRKENISKEKIIHLKQDLVSEKSIKNTLVKIIAIYFKDNKTLNQNLIKKLLGLSDNFGNNLSEFLKFTALSSGLDIYQPKLENVSLMTLHSAKGLEFKCVFIIGCEDGLLPYSLFENQKSNPAEEKRLLYVGMTRAKQFLFLSYAKNRFIFNRNYLLPKSPFLAAIEKNLIELTKLKQKKTNKKEVQPTFF